MNTTAIITFLIVTVTIAIVTWYTTRKESLTTAQGYFLGGRHLGWFLVGGSLFLSNVSAGTLVGESEAAYLFNMSIMMWGFSSIAAMVIVSEFILPIYLRFGVATTPEFLGIRFDKSLKTWVAVLILIAYASNMMPPVLYSGAVVFNGLFDISGALGVSDWVGIWILVWAIGIVGSLYAIFGGLKAIAASDAINGVGLVIGGCLVPYFGLKYLGNGDVGAGLTQLIADNPTKMNVLGGPGDPVPWPTLFTGMLLVNLNYWGMEQYIIQRALASKNLKEGQKGMVFAMFLKFLSPVVLALPGVIAVAILADVKISAEVYPLLVAEVVPAGLLGFIAAIVFGAALTSFNSGLNSSSTLAMLDIYKPYQESKGIEPTDVSLINMAKKFQILLAIVAMLIAPFIAFASDGFYNYIQKVAGMFTIPIFTIIFMGFVTKRIPALAAKVAMVFYLFCYGFTQLVYDFGLHFLHIMAILFVCSCIIMLVIGQWKPRATAFEYPKAGRVDLTPWSKRYYFYALALIAMGVVIYTMSPAGIAAW